MTTTERHRASIIEPRVWIAIFGALAALLAGAMTALAIGGVGQEYYESVHPPSEYAARLVSQGGSLRLLFALDNLFLLSYASFFVAYYNERRGKADAVLLALTLGAVLLAAVMDAAENFHILSMLHAAERGELPSSARIELQYVASAIKFTVGYFAAIGLAITYPRNSTLARGVALSTGVVFPLVGVLVFASSGMLETVLAIARTMFFVSGYALSAFVFWKGRSIRRPDEEALVTSPA
jgi:hypothetical protein